MSKLNFKSFFDGETEETQSFEDHI